MLCEMQSALSMVIWIPIGIQIQIKVPCERGVCLLGDEMHIKEDLVYKKMSGELVGFVNLGDVNENLMQLEQQLQEVSSESPVLAFSVFVLMVRGLFTGLKFPYATFPCKSTCGDQLVPIFFEAVFRLESCGFKVVDLAAQVYIYIYIYIYI